MRLTNNRGRESRRAGRTLRQGMAAMETVMVAAISLPVAAFLLFLAFRMCRYVYQAIAHLVGSPFM